MKHEDTINLLKECNAGVKMGVDSIDDVLGYVQNENLKQNADGKQRRTPTAGQ